MALGRSEEAYGEKIDRCMYNTLIKFVGGVGVGIVCSVALFKRKPWPMLLGAGVGIGMGISDCNNEFKGQSDARPVSNSNEGKVAPAVELKGHKIKGKGSSKLPPKPLHEEDSLILKKK